MTFDELTNRLASIAPDLTDVAIATAKAQVLREFTGNAGILTITSGFFYGIYRWGRYVYNKPENNRSDGDALITIIAVVSSFFGLLLWGAALLSLLDPVLWASLSDPRIWLANKVLK